jgi:hypothetical protein
MRFEGAICGNDSPLRSRVERKPEDRRARDIERRIISYKYLICKIILPTSPSPQMHQN